MEHDPIRRVDLGVSSARVIVAALLLIPVAIALATGQLSGSGWSFQSEQIPAADYSTRSIGTSASTEPETTPSGTTEVTATLETETCSVPCTCASVATTITSTVTSLSTSYVTRTFSATATETQVQTQSSPFLTIPGFPLEAIAIGFAVAFALFLMRRRR